MTLAGHLRPENSDHFRFQQTEMNSGMDAAQVPSMKTQGIGLAAIICDNVELVRAL
jgi:hypothetical protein